MDAPVDAVDHHVGLPFELVLQASFDEPPDDRRGRTYLNREVRRRTSLAAKRALHGADDVAPVGHLA